MIRVNGAHTRPRVLVAEDDRSVRESLVLALELEGYEVEAVGDGEKALAAFAASEPDVVLLDVMMPFVDGLTVCRRLRARGTRVPILMLTARHEVADRVSGLDAGADDYVVKPFALDELTARLRALLRRTSVTGEETTIQVGDLELDPLGRTASRAGVALDLTKTEFDLLELLMFNQGIVLGRSQIYEEIWDYDFGPDSKNLAVYISYLRRKVDDDHDVKLIHTVRGVGYTLRAD